MKVRFLKKNYTLPAYGTKGKFYTYAKGQVADLYPDTPARMHQVENMIRHGFLEVLDEKAPRRRGRPRKDQISATTSRDVGNLPPE